MNRIPAFVVVGVLVIQAAAGGAKSAAVDPEGAWHGEVEHRVRLRGTRFDPASHRSDLTLAEDRWWGEDAGSFHEGTRTTLRSRSDLELDEESLADRASDLAHRIEERMAEDGLTVEAEVLITRVRSKVKARENRNAEKNLRVRQSFRFEVTLTGDIERTRRGILKVRGTLERGSRETSRTASSHETAVPYIDDPVAFWARSDLYVMRPDVLPLDRWPDEVLFPSDHGIRIIVLLPGDYRGRSNGSLADGVLYIADSGTEESPILVAFAPFEGADLRETPHAAERFRESEAWLTGFRIWNQRYQFLHGLTFADGVSACLLHTASDNVIDGCLWHETQAQPLRIRFNSHRNTVQRCVMRRFDPELWGHNDTVAIQLSDESLTHNRIVGNVILNYTDSYQHTDRDGDPYGLGAGTIIDGNFMGFTEEAHLDEPEGQLLCGENTIDLKMGGTEEEPVIVSNNVFFGVRAAKAGCAASGSGGYAITPHRRGTWVEFRDNVFVDCDSGIFLNSFFLNVDQAQGRIDPHLTITGNTFSGITSYSTAFPARTGRVLSGLSPADFRDNVIVGCDGLMESEPAAGPWELVIEDNAIYGALDTSPRGTAEIEGDGNSFHAVRDTVRRLLHIPWTERRLEVRVPRTD